MVELLLALVILLGSVVAAIELHSLTERKREKARLAEKHEAAVAAESYLASRYVSRAEKQNALLREPAYIEHKHAQPVLIPPPLPPERLSRMNAEELRSLDAYEYRKLKKEEYQGAQPWSDVNRKATAPVMYNAGPSLNIYGRSGWPLTQGKGHYVLGTGRTAEIITNPPEAIRHAGLLFEQLDGSDIEHALRVVDEAHFPFSSLASGLRGVPNCLCFRKGLPNSEVFLCPSPDRAMRLRLYGAMARREDNFCHTEV